MIGRTWLAGIVIATLALGCGDKLQPGGKTSHPEATGPAADLARTPIPKSEPQIRAFKRPDGATFKPADFDAKRRIDLDALGFGSATKLPNLCFQPPQIAESEVGIHDALFVHDRATLDARDFSLQRTLAKLASDAVTAGAPASTADDLFVALWDTQNTQAAARTPGVGAHCDDDGSTLNGFPNVCRPKDGAQAKAANLANEIASYKVVGLVNRIDLAAEGWQNCGEHRIVYGRNGGGSDRSFIIFEAVLPNPRPGCASGCRPVVEHWQKLSTESVPARRAELLEQLFFAKIPNTQLREVVNIVHYAAKPSTSTGYGSAGSGQIRTNQFLDPLWMLKEFKLAVDCTAGAGNCVVDAVPIPVKVNPDGNLWAASTSGLANDFQQQVVLPQVADLAIADINKFSYQVPLVFDAARSVPQSPSITDDYPKAYKATGTGSFKPDLLGSATAHGLTDVHIVNRATALSCAGCHQPGAFGLLAPGSIAPNVAWPDSTGRFVHVDIAEQGGSQILSPALLNDFLPARQKNMAAVLNADVCLCRFRKAPLAPAVIERIEREVSPRPPRSVQDLRDRETRMKRRLDQELARARRPRLPELGSLEGPGVALEEVQAEIDPAKKSVARVRAIQKLVGEESPRKTVTGHFRAH
jgi:hypothetical protein